MTSSPLKVLLGHNFYRSSAPSGEDTVFRNEQQLLESSGIEVIPFTRNNDEIDESSLGKRINLALDGAWSKKSYAAISALIKKTKPDIAHFHNTFPQISPSAYAACQDNDIPVVQTLHNFRLICPGALLQREGVPCEDCVGHSLLPAMRHRCYRGSFSATSAQVWMLSFNRMRKSYTQLVNRYITLTRFAAGRLQSGGLPADRFSIKPNFLPDPPAIGEGRGGYAVFVGRLSEEKGVRTLLKAWDQLPHLPLKILGDGPLNRELREFATQQNLPIEFLGYRKHEEILAIVRDAAMQVVPSEWYEGFPMVILEAYACGTPVVAAKIGSLDEIVIDNQTGRKFTPGDQDSLAKCVGHLLQSEDKLVSLRPKVRQQFDRLYTADTNLSQLLGIYQQVIQSK